MQTGHPPFQLPSGSDAYYKYISQNLFPQFFIKHSSNLKNGFEIFTEDFMNLISTMLIPSAINRLSLAEIKSHPWFISPNIAKH